MTSSLLKKVTPLILTLNEAPNIGTTLESLRWADQVVVVDSESTDETEQIARGYPNVKWHTRRFDSHLAQWRYGIESTEITSEYVLALDADMQVTTDFLTELQSTFLSGKFAAGIVKFEYRYYGHTLGGSLCPPQLRVFRRSEVCVKQPDHTQHFDVDGSKYQFKSALIHDDRKPLERFVASQLSYQVLNERELSNGGRKRLRDHLRKLGLMPPIAALLAYFRAGGPFYGAAAARYAYERAVCESLLAIRLLNRRLESEELARNNAERRDSN